MRKHISYAAAATGEQTRELTTGELDQIAGGSPNVTVNGGPLAFIAPMMPYSYDVPSGSMLGHEPVHGRA
jgi:uncharacterized Zn-binding protein involved in type VI secretion